MVQDPSGYAIDTLWDVANVIYDAGKIGYGKLTGNDDLVSEGVTDLFADAAAAAVPFVPAGSTKVARAVGEGVEEIAEARKASKATAKTDSKDGRATDAPSRGSTNNGAESSQSAGGTKPNSATEIGSQNKHTNASSVENPLNENGDAVDSAKSTIYRRGTDKESPTRLNRKAQEAENSNIGIHGVSGSRTATPGCSSATCADLEASGFKVHDTPTRADPKHVTIELPKPVTKEDAARFNDAFGRN